MLHNRDGTDLNVLADSLVMAIRSNNADAGAKSR
jgi:hypothetical protein